MSDSKKIFFTPIKQEMSFGPNDNMLGKVPMSPGFGPSTEAKLGRELPKINAHQILPPPRNSSLHSQMVAPTGTTEKLKPITAVTNYSFVSADDINPNTKSIVQSAIQSFSQKVAESGVRIAHAQGAQNVQAQPKNRRQLVAGNS